jgi:hypothetical protein
MNRGSRASVSARLASSVTLLLLAAAAPVGSQSQAYGPFGPTEHYSVGLDTCKGDLDVRGGPRFPQEPGDHVPPLEGRMEYSRPGVDVHLRVTIDDEAYVAQLFVKDEPRSQSTPLSIISPIDLGEAAICDDLNRDGVVDFVATLWHHGNGLGASFYQRFVLLSDGPSYRAWTLETMWPAQEDFVTFGRIEPIVMVTREIVQTHGPERYFGHPPEHSYIVHDLWAFHGSRVVSVNSIDTRFPVWIWFTYKPNRLPATSVDAAARQRFRPTPQTPVELPR